MAKPSDPCSFRLSTGGEDFNEPSGESKHPADHVRVGKIESTKAALDVITGYGDVERDVVIAADTLGALLNRFQPRRGKRRPHVFLKHHPVNPAKLGDRIDGCITQQRAGHGTRISWTQRR